MNYTPKPFSRITPSIGENRMKIRSVDFESIEYRQTDTHTFIFIYIDLAEIYIYIIPKILPWAWFAQQSF